MIYRPAQEKARHYGGKAQQPTLIIHQRTSRIPWSELQSHHYQLPVTLRHLWPVPAADNHTTKHTPQGTAGPAIFPKQEPAEKQWCPSDPLYLDSREAGTPYCNSYPSRASEWRYERGNKRAHKKVAQWDGAPESSLTGLEAWRMVFMPDFPPVLRIVELTIDSSR